MMREISNTLRENYYFYSKNNEQKCDLRMHSNTAQKYICYL